jgi:O-antigen ligase
MTLLLTIIGVSICAILTYLLWAFAKFEWLPKISSLLVISLPFERIPSISLGGSNIRISQLLVLLGMWTFFVLLFKRDSELMKTQINRFNYFLFAFLLFSIPSWFMITDFKRFIVTEFAAVIVFAGFFLLSQFARDLVDRVKDIINTMIFVTLFGYYQFVGDMIGLPLWLTGLRENYTKIVFGIPRIHATAIEPLYFAGMLFLCIFVTASYFYLDKQLVYPRILKFLRLDNFSNHITNGSLFIFFLVAFFLTLSKSAIVVFLAMFPFFIFLLVQIFNINLFLVFRRSWKTLATISTILISVYSFTPSVQSIWSGIYSNFADTIYGQSASSGERSLFLKAFNEMIVNNTVFGISSGHYGVEAGYYIPFQTGLDSYLIVNNVYLEIWLEHGLIPLLCFLGLLSVLSFVFLRKIIMNLRQEPEASCVNVSVFFAFLAYCFQWLTFSPIFIMPIFIIMGLIANQVSVLEK